MNFYFAYNKLHILLRKSISIEFHCERLKEIINKFWKKIYFIVVLGAFFFLLCCIHKHSRKNLFEDLGCWPFTWNFLQKTTMYRTNPITIELAMYITLLSHSYVALGIFLADI